MAVAGPRLEGAIAPLPQGPDMRGGIALSATLHAGLCLLIVLGLPTLFHQPPPEETPIAVQLVTIAPETRATHPNPFRPKAEAKPDAPVAPPAPKPEPKPEPAPAVPAPPPSAAAPPPMPAPPVPAEKPLPPPPKPLEAQKAPPVPPPLPEPKPRPEPQQAPHQMAHPDPKKADPAAFDKLVKSLEQKRPAPAEFDKLVKKLEQKRQQPGDFDALLKNLTRQETAEADEPRPVRQRVAAAAPPSSRPKAPLGSQLTASEKDLIIQQIERCWVVPAGARDADNLIIEIKAVVEPDGTVRQATIVDSGRYAADAFFRAAADSAKRAVLNPQCSPLHVPPDKYEAWHNLDLFFNPKDLL